MYHTYRTQTKGFKVSCKWVNMLWKANNQASTETGGRWDREACRADAAERCTDVFLANKNTAVEKFPEGAIPGLPHQSEESIAGTGAGLPGSIPDDTIISFSSTPPQQHAAPEVMKCGCLNENKHENEGPACWNDIHAPKCNSNKCKSSLQRTQSADPQPRIQTFLHISVQSELLWNGISHFNKTTRQRNERKLVSSGPVNPVWVSISGLAMNHTQSPDCFLSVFV